MEAINDEVWLSTGMPRVVVRWDLLCATTVTLKAWMIITVALFSPIVVTVDAQLKRCDASKIAIATYPVLNLPAGRACGADALGGRPISSIFEAVISDATIAKMVAAPSCQAWWSALARAFTSLPSCTFLGKNVQDFGLLSLEAS
ncbi:hypothetical protein AC1031_005998 [Aphanomyces cochlioides]|nr:hypothetical protein AC1031_005998 [Aphanomyces cochlioides]